MSTSVVLITGCSSGFGEGAPQLLNRSEEAVAGHRDRYDGEDPAQVHGCSPLERRGYLPTARASSALVIFERPSMPFCLASL